LSSATAASLRTTATSDNRNMTFAIRCRHIDNRQERNHKHRTHQRNQLLHNTTFKL
jgi:hypothetical protein